MGGAGSEEGGPLTGAGALDGRVSGRERSGGVRSGVEEGEELGREEGPHGILSGGIRRGMRRNCARPAERAKRRRLGVAAERAKRRKLGRVRIFTDAQATITRMTHDEPSPGQAYALQARKAIQAYALQARKAIAALEIEIRWCPAHKGIPGNEIADGWDKQAASEPDDHGVEDTCQRRPTTLTANLPSAFEAQGIGEVAGSPVVVRVETTQQGVRPPGERQGRPNPSQGGEANGLEALPAQFWVCLHGRVLEEFG